MDSQRPPSSTVINSQADKIQRVMLVDDHEVFRYGLRKLLANSETFRIVAEASTCEDASKQMQSMPIDLILLDLHLSDINGMEAIHQLKKGSPAPDIIIISATIDDDILLDALVAGISGYLTKDISADEILDRLYAYQCGELALTSTLASRAIELLVHHYSMLEGELTTYRQNQMKALLQQAPSTVPPPVFSMPQQTRNPLPVLTPQEEKVYQSMRRGWSNKQIAAELYISRFTVGKHVQNILRKLGVTNRTQAVSYMLFEGDEEVEGQ